MANGYLSVVIFAITCSVGQSFAVENPPPAQTSKHPLAECMTRRMSAERTLSYNDAAKACKEQIKARKVESASNNLPKPLS